MCNSCHGHIQHCTDCERLVNTFVNGSRCPFCQADPQGGFTVKR